MSLWSQFIEHDGRGVQKWSQYFAAYENHLARFEGRPVRLLEIGVNRGGSLQLWKKYLGPRAIIVGLDIDPACKQVEEPQIHVRIGSQTDTALLQSIDDEFGPFDVVLDDGSHQNAHQIATMEFLYPRMSPTGVYLVEDVHTSYMERYAGGLHREGTFIERAKHLIDELHADYAGEALAPSAFTRSTTSLHFYDSVVAFERAPHPQAVSVDRGHPPLNRK
ncbi:class I SAM-dependent methyltransferase [Epidermidibacterium keratini]|uniref:Class I SAM-dependent methyltransferase n=1 Tax=Epidermidibacterium keratini TaxID=1891644 RepID=A0A7L4YRE2_9ACTN|nr:class I SAM-dependent methyltransferase [Epidermidibacterium keratini]QHC01484.1 class I SAM-dependent methyltransferase [Epidermidibacterium keratini]